MKNLNKFLFIILLIMSTLISLSSNSWFGMWAGLEINLMAFIPLMMGPQNSMSSESSLKYFLTQALASSLMLFFILMFLSNLKQTSMFNNLFNFLLSSTLLLKLGAAPFHFWLPSVMEGLTWHTNFTLMTWQKIAPLFILSYCINLFMLIQIIILSTLIGALGGLNQTSLRKLMAFSSINHIGWLIASLIYNEMISLLYFIFYLFLNLNVSMLFNNFKLFNIKQTLSTNFLKSKTKTLTFLVLLSLGGLPPFLGFFPKWIIIEMLIIKNFMFILLFMLAFSLITLYFYLRISFSSFLFSNQFMAWSLNNQSPYLSFKFTLFLSIISLMGMFFLNFFTLLL